ARVAAEAAGAPVPARGAGAGRLGVDASGVDASGVEASGADASGADASGADASGVEASGVDASGAFGLGAVGCCVGLGGVDCGGVDRGCGFGGRFDSSASMVLRTFSRNWPIRSAGRYAGAAWPASPGFFFSALSAAFAAISIGIAERPEKSPFASGARLTAFRMTASTLSTTSSVTRGLF
ncbi:pentapeptide repeat-containing protein, partial [Burkholderia pseudomallei]|nr:pentapeptide repeat-containing protein [Burkholderia pseudomallei]